ncbi:MAG: GDYXXLXY domain-containing protein [Verrucomicrobiae bacterium]|nr:GDYXXLXY domain-containing protein [Verrucomicrobiae bacterium]
MKRVLLLAIIITTFFIGWAGYQEWSWHSLPTARLELDPADPYDVLRGRYFILNPTVENISRSTNQNDREILKKFYAERGTNLLEKVYVIFEPDREGIAQPIRITSKTPSLTTNQFALLSRDRYYRRRYSHLTGDYLDLNFQLKRFYLPSRLELPAQERQKGWQIEVILRPNYTAIPKALWFKEQLVYPH